MIQNKNLEVLLWLGFYLIQALSFVMVYYQNFLTLESFTSCFNELLACMGTSNIFCILYTLKSLILFKPLAHYLKSYFLFYDGRNSFKLQQLPIHKQICWRLRTVPNCLHYITEYNYKEVMVHLQKKKNQFQFVSV